MKNARKDKRLVKPQDQKLERQGVERDPRASDHQNALKAQRKALRKKHEAIVWKGTLAGLTLRQIAADNPGLSAAAACRMKKKVLRKWAVDTEGFIERWTDIETARAEDRTAVVTKILRDEKTPEMKLQCIDRLEKISARLAKLLGLDAATQVIITKEVLMATEEIIDVIKFKYPDIDMDEVLASMGEK